MSYQLRIADLPTDERPRERLLELGAANLSTAELLAILLATGQGAGGLSAVGLGQLILQTLSEAQQAAALDRLRDVNAAELTAIKGVGPAKATAILAAIELGKRVFQLRPAPRAEISSPQMAVAALSHDLMWQPQERFATLLLDTQNRLITTKIISIGTATETLVHPRDIFREAIRQNATRLLVAHNHPSGNLKASPEDIALTRQILAAANLLMLPVLDHLIVGQGDFCSLRQTTTLWEDYPQGDIG
ncbi:MAG: RadC family protein [Spirulinaceae cyanobacterium]